jgi:nucleoside-diphosphate-sugar epimerase
MPPQDVLVTGATGFVGASLVLDLLRSTDDTIACLVRDRPGHNAGTRLAEHLARTAAAYGDDHLVGQITERVRPVIGDIGDIDLPRLAGELGGTKVVWHSAASLKYRDADVDEIRTTNVEGTRHVVALADALGVDEFNYISTAYVAGQQRGMVFEEEVPVGHPTNNQYERSKVDAEAVVLGLEGLRRRVFRPSIVIGHSTTFAADSASGVFGFLREMSRFTRIAAAREQAAFQLLADPDTTLNFIPVDLVTSSAVDIALKGSGETFFHLTNGTPAVVGEAIPVAAEMLGLAPPVFTSDPAHLTRLDRRLSRFLDFYLPYLGADREFDRTNTDAVVGDRCDFGMGTPAIAQLVGAWMESAALN